MGLLYYLKAKLCKTFKAERDEQIQLLVSLTELFLDQNGNIS